MKAHNKRHWVLIAYIVVSTAVLIDTSSTLSALKKRQALLEQVTTSQQHVLNNYYDVLLNHTKVLTQITEQLKNFWM